MALARQCNRLIRCRALRVCCGLYYKGLCVTGLWNKCEKTVKNYVLRMTVKQQPAGLLSVRLISHCSR